MGKAGGGGGKNALQIGLIMEGEMVLMRDL